ncbi:hypothetical protein A3F38_03060 [Candidatus Saccharibacteria bacterium RIFCSPHIGHO2_12_FULL_48_21]|nr:MAG: hypothetical protein A3F38_03060 [Candidatus Saccharibacteria bacterium RIFCSPHIGHO2_12_FULL_48_21]
MDIKEAYRYCPRCGAKFNKQPGHLQCPDCGLSYYLNSKPVQSVILKNEKDEYLFVVRSVEPRKGYLDFPGGFVEEGENFEDSSRREIREEIGIDIGGLEYLSTHADEYLYQGINYKVSGITYLGVLPKNVEFKPADDVESCELYRLSDIPMSRLAWPSMHEMIANLKAKFE